MVGWHAGAWCGLLLAASCAAPERKPGGDPAEAVDTAAPTSLARVDRFPQPAPVDVLFLIDNSCSMSIKQYQTVMAIPPFVSGLEQWNLSYHIGAIATDMSHEGSPEPDNTRGRLRRTDGQAYVTPEADNPVSAVCETLMMSIDGSTHEEGRAPLVRALEDERDGWNAGFQRPEAALHIVVLSDEDDHTGGEAGGPGGDPDRASFIRFLEELKEGGPTVPLHAIVNLPDSDLPLGEEVGAEYIAIAEAVGGRVVDIRAPLEPFFDEVVLDIALSAQEYFLSERPVVGSLEVYAEDRLDLDSGEWFYDPLRNSVRIHGLLEPQVEVVVQYDAEPER